MAGDSANQLLSPKDLTVNDQDGNPRTYIMSKFPATVGRELVSNYLTSSIPKVGEYTTNAAMMLKLMSYVAVPVKGGQPLRLVTEALVNNHVPDWETLTSIEIEVMRYNSSFFLHEKISTFFDVIMERLTQKVTEILTGSLRQSSILAKPPSKN